jgi:hypothetical protein
MPEYLAKISDPRLLLLVNLYICIIGAVFISSNNLKNKEKFTAKKGLFICWASLSIYYTLLLIAWIAQLRISNYIVIDLFNELSTGSIFFVALISFNLKERKAFIYSLLFGFISWSSFIYRMDVLIPGIFAMISMFLLGFSHRNVNINYSLIMVSYGLSQLPIHVFLRPDQFEGNIFISFLLSVLLLKLSLISAHYSILGHKN